MTSQKGEERASLDYGSQRTLWKSESGVHEISLDGEEVVSDEERAHAKPTLKQKCLIQCT